MKAVLISIKPKWCELIASGKKTVEVRKTRPKIDTPFKCYIYCTKGETLYRSVDDNNIRLTKKGRAEALKHHTLFNGKVVGEFVCKHINAAMAMLTGTDISIFYQSVIDASCLSNDEVEKYGNGKTVYAWHISDLVIYDKPKELNEFSKIKAMCHRGIQKDNCIDCWECEMTRPPQSWCYVEELEVDDEKT